MTTNASGPLPAGTRVLTHDGLAGVITGLAPGPGPAYWVDLGAATPFSPRYWNAWLWSWLYNVDELDPDRSEGAQPAA